MWCGDEKTNAWTIRLYCVKLIIMIVIWQINFNHCFSKFSVDKLSNFYVLESIDLMNYRLFDYMN